MPLEAKYQRRHRERLRERGRIEILLHLPIEDVKTLDRLRATIASTLVVEFR